MRIGKREKQLLKNAKLATDSESPAGKTEKDSLVGLVKMGLRSDDTCRGNSCSSSAGVGGNTLARLATKEFQSLVAFSFLFSTNIVWVSYNPTTSICNSSPLCPSITKNPGYFSSYCIS